jgi:transcriptional regulator with XRE-family HTH domain
MYVPPVNFSSTYCVHSPAKPPTKRPKMHRFSIQLLHFRKAAGLTQANLAESAGICVTAVRSVERGQGRVSTLDVMLTVLGLEMRGRQLIAGPIGNALAFARKRRGLSRRRLALAIHISRDSLAAIEAGGGLVSGMLAYGGAVGAQLHLAKIGDERPFYLHAANSSAHHGWETPKDLADILTEAVGGFDLDPCAASHSRRKARVKAKVLLTVDDDGLSVPWRGMVFVNPPYGRGTTKDWVAKCKAEAASGRATVVALLPVRTDARWWHELVAGHAHVFMLNGSLKFGDSTGTAPFASAVVVYGGDPGTIGRLAAALPSAWHVQRAA